MRNNKKTLTAILAVFALAAAAPAYGQEVQGSDNPPGPTISGEIVGGGNGTTPDNGGGGTVAGDAGGNVAAARNADPAADEGGNLPFTGADLGLVAAAGAFLLAFGLGMRRLTRSPNAA